MECADRTSSARTRSKVTCGRGLCPLWLCVRDGGWLLPLVLAGDISARSAGALGDRANPKLNPDRLSLLSASPSAFSLASAGATLGAFPVRPNPIGCGVSVGLCEHVYDHVGV